MDVREFQQLKKKVENLQSQADREQGVLERLQGQLKSEYGCSSLKQAKQLLAEREVEKDVAEQEFEAALREFKEHFGEFLGIDTEADD